MPSLDGLLASYGGVLVPTHFPFRGGALDAPNGNKYIAVTRTGFGTSLTREVLIDSSSDGGATWTNVGYFDRTTLSVSAINDVATAYAGDALYFLCTCVGTAALKLLKFDTTTDSLVTLADGPAYTSPGTQKAFACASADGASIRASFNQDAEVISGTPYSRVGFADYDIATDTWGTTIDYAAQWGTTISYNPSYVIEGDGGRTHQFVRQGSANYYQITRNGSTVYSEQLCHSSGFFSGFPCMWTDSNGDKQLALPWLNGSGALNVDLAASVDNPTWSTSSSIATGVTESGDISNWGDATSVEMTIAAIGASGGKVCIFYNVATSVNSDPNPVDTEVRKITGDGTWDSPTVFRGLGSPGTLVYPAGVYPISENIVVLQRIDTSTFEPWFNIFSNPSYNWSAMRHVYCEDTAAVVARPYVSAGGPGAGLGTWGVVG